MKDEYLVHSSIETVAMGDYSADIVENPLRVLTQEEREALIKDAFNILEQTMNIEDKSDEDIAKYLFGKPDGGKVLYLFKKDEQLVGYMSCHLLNAGGEILRYNGSTILHGGSAHILPKEQGKYLWRSTVVHYLNRLPQELRPKYVEGFTQSPRVFRLMHILAMGKVFPNPDRTQDLSELQHLQEFVLPQIVSTKGDFSIKHGSVVKGMSTPVYKENESAGVKFDDFFYTELGIDVENGDFLHFVAEIPVSMYRE